MKRRLFTAIGIAFTVVSLYIAFRDVHYRDILDTFRTTKFLWGGPVLAATILSIWLRAFRWKIMLAPIKDVPIGRVYSATMIGFMANNVLPMRLGELVRAYAVGHSSGVSKSSAFATIVVERAFDLVAILLFLGVVLLRTPLARWVQVTGYVALTVCLGMFVMMALLHWKRAATIRVFNLLTSRLPKSLEDKVNGLMHRFLDGLRVLGSWKRIAWVTVLSLATWLAVALGYWFTFLAFDLVLPLRASIVLVVVTALAVMLPSGPGFVGTFEVGAKYGMMLFDVSENVALSYALFYHAVQFFPITLLGFYHIWREKFSLSTAVRDQGDEKDREDGAGP